MFFSDTVGVVFGKGGEIAKETREIEEVENMHHMHIWQLTEELIHLKGHVEISDVLNRPAGDGPRQKRVIRCYGREV